MPDAPPAPPPAPGLAMQLGIYDPARAADPPPVVAPEEWERRARAALADGPFGYVAGGAGSDATVRANLAAFERRPLLPRMARDVARRDLAVTLLGQPLPAPVALAPIGVLGILHPEGELPAARAAAREGVPFVCSTVSSATLEAVAAAMDAVRPDAPRWFQLYPSRVRELSASLVARAERAGYGAIVVTLDTTMLGWRETDLANRYLPFLGGQGIANYVSDPVFRALLPAPPEADPRRTIEAFLGVYVNPGFTWEELGWLRARTRLPVVAKGVLHPDDARRALDVGCDGVVVSNHGGRQVDGAVAALDALPAVAAAVRRAAGTRAAVLMDSGVRRGGDVLRALALDADAVLFGRPWAYALAAAGEAGVTQAVRTLLADLDLTLGLCGVASVGAVDGTLLAPAGSHEH